MKEDLYPNSVDISINNIIYKFVHVYVVFYMLYPLKPELLMIAAKV